ncbi:MAG: hydrogenase maturation peptidase HycI [Spirochaetia bacterium]|jgi:hydrogenase 3 maturation protease
MQKLHLLPALKRALKAETPSGARTVVVLGVGSEMRSDDAAGLRVAAAVSAWALQGVHALEAGPAPENCTAEIRRLHPAHLIMVDCAQMGEEPGTLTIFQPSEIAGVSFGTHGLPLSVLAEYLQAEVGCSVAVLGIQPSNVDFGETLSPRIERAVGEAAQLLREFLIK